ncbi:uncharacterized protein LOC110687673 [Chenopodium quinoa]|uniref:uncharacterized protein LOC110687673 n=1 Tax=Chenopodium quinoa TaxID=63459 RepID=UPI000B77A1E2|nr:uncharacterized protein LOC110687673 [Chenopodium quinoa]
MQTRAKDGIFKLNPKYAGCALTTTSQTQISPLSRSHLTAMNDPNWYAAMCDESIYGLKQAPKAWYQRFATHILSLGFVNSKSDIFLFIFRRGMETAYLLLYVDDIILACSSDHLRKRVISLLSAEFAMKDLSPLSSFFDISVTRTPEHMFLYQRSYAQEILARVDMSSCKSASTPVDTKSKLSATSGKQLDNPTLYRQLAA